MRLLIFLSAIYTLTPILTAQRYGPFEGEVCYKDISLDEFQNSNSDDDSTGLEETHLPVAGNAVEQEEAPRNRPQFPFVPKRPLLLPQRKTNKNYQVNVKLGRRRLDVSQVSNNPRRSKRYATGLILHDSTAPYIIVNSGLGIF